MLRVVEKPHRIGVRLDELEKAAVERAAASSGLSMSEWTRRAIARAIDAERAAPAEPQEAPERPVELSPQVSKFMAAVRAANKRDRAFR